MDSTRLAQNEESTRNRIAALWGRARATRVRFDTLSTDLLAECAASVESSQSSGASSRAALVERAVARHDEDAKQIGLALEDLVQRLAPGSWSGGFESAQHPPLGGPAAHCRIGSYAAGGRTVPALHSLFDGPAWVIESEPEQAQNLIKNVVLRSLDQVPLRHLSITVYDPRLRGFLGEIAAVRTTSSNTFPPSLQDAGHLVNRLDEVLSDAARNAETVVASGAASVREQWLAAGRPSGRVHLVVVLDFPTGLDEQALRKLAALTTVGGSTGTALIVHRQPTSRPTADARRLLEQFAPIVWGQSGWTVRAGPPELAVAPDPVPSADTIAAVVARASEAVTSFQGETIRLETLMAGDIADSWTGSAARSLDAVIGRADGRDLVVSLRTENPPHPNVLLGGAVGQGKSNLMLDLIYSLAVRYSPAELELYLLDFKQGLEFKRFDADEQGSGWLPHIRALSLESNQEFGLAVLRHVESEMSRRAARFKEVGATRIDTFRTASTEPMPRLLLVIDEFHVLFDGEDDLVDEAVNLLERLAKQGRAYGIHILLGSQTVSGLRALATRGDAIFAQFPIRLSLKNTAAESQAILSQGNSAAANLTYRGEVIVNNNFGNDSTGSNVRGMSAYADPDVFSRVQRRLWERDHGDRPLVFVASEPATWDPARLDAMGRGHRVAGEFEVWIGRPIALTDEPYRVLLTDDVDQTLAVIGPNGEAARAVLESVLATGIRSLGSGSRVTVLDGAAESGNPWFDRVKRLAVAAGVSVEVLSRDEVGAALLGPLAAAMDGDTTRPGLVVALGMQRVRGLDVAPATDAEPVDVDSFAMPNFDEPVTPRTVLRRLATEGALAGLPLLAWWPNLRAAEADLGPTFAGVRAFVTAGLGLEDLRVIGGPHVRQPQGSPRVGVLDRLASGALDVVVPFGPVPTAGGS